MQDSRPLMKWLIKGSYLCSVVNANLNQSILLEVLNAVMSVFSVAVVIKLNTSRQALRVLRWHQYPAEHSLRWTVSNPCVVVMYEKSRCDSTSEKITVNLVNICPNPSKNETDVPQAGQNNKSHKIKLNGSAGAWPLYRWPFKEWPGFPDVGVAHAAPRRFRDVFFLEELLDGLSYDCNSVADVRGFILAVDKLKADQTCVDVKIRQWAVRVTTKILRTLSNAKKTHRVLPHETK